MDRVSTSISYFLSDLQITVKRGSGPKYSKFTPALTLFSNVNCQHCLSYIVNNINLREKVTLVTYIVTDFKNRFFLTLKKFPSDIY